MTFFSFRAFYSRKPDFKKFGIAWAFHYWVIMSKNCIELWQRNHVRGLYLEKKKNYRNRFLWMPIIFFFFFAFGPLRSDRKVNVNVLAKLVIEQKINWSMGIDLVFIEEVQPRHLSPETNEKKKKGKWKSREQKKKKMQFRRHSIRPTTRKLHDDFDRLITCLSAFGRSSGKNDHFCHSGRSSKSRSFWKGWKKDHSE